MTALNYKVREQHLKKTVRAAKIKRNGGLVITAIMILVIVSGGSSNDTFTDSRDGSSYGTVRAGKRMWMKRNLNYETGVSWCYNNDKSNCKKYGRLYDWNTAMKACPAGWRLPNDADWDDLFQAVGGREIAGKNLKSRTADWYGNGGGADVFGFSALPGGHRAYIDGFFAHIGDYGYWWSATDHGPHSAHCRRMYYHHDDVIRGHIDSKRDGLSVRCVRE